MSQIKTTSMPAESGHWYTTEGEQVQYVPRASKEGVRKPTLRDARKHGWMPGVTTILRQAAAPGLVRWQQERTIEATLELEQQPDEQHSEYVRRVLARASEQASQAATVGGEIHKAIEQYFSGQMFDKFYRAHVLGVADAIEQACATADTLHPWLAEKGVAHVSGFGTKVDLHSEAWVLDFKSKDGTTEDWQGSSGNLTTYPNHWMQLAAGRKALEQCHGWPLDGQRCAIVYVSRTHPGIAEFVEVPEDRLQRGWSMFQSLLAYWKAANNYEPNGVRQ